MIEPLVRKARQLAGDPILRRWLRGRLLGRHPGEPPFVPHRPPYLDGLLPLAPESAAVDFGELSPPPPAAAIELPLAGRRERLQPGGEAALFERSFADGEVGVAVQRFAWLPLLGEAADPAWVAALWRGWSLRFAKPADGPAWDPYTAAERAINVLDFACRRGLPGPRESTLAVLAAHGPAIAERLEYFGDHHTSNHLANDGRGIYLLGLALGLERSALVGGRVLIAEAGRIFSPAGVLNEGSSHYHLLLTRNYASAWLAARAAGRPETEALEGVVRRCLAVIPAFVLPGGLALVGDVSPDCPPEFLLGLVPGSDPRQGWTGQLADADRRALVALRDSVAPVAAEALQTDGWLRADFAPWSALWHVAPGGWSPMPGHGHQDVGGFELHHGSEPLFRDLGRGAYGESGDAAFYRSAAAHNGLTVDGADPFPPNKPYYDRDFRRRIGGPPPRLAGGDREVSLSHHGFARLQGLGRVDRIWRFSKVGFSITDRIEGGGRHRVVRRLHTPLAVEPAAGGAVIGGASGRFRLRAEGRIGVRPVTCWRAYGSGEPAAAIEIAAEVELPWESTLAVEIA